LNRGLCYNSHNVISSIPQVFYKAVTNICHRSAIDLP